MGRVCGGFRRGGGGAFRGQAVSQIASTAHETQQVFLLAGCRGRDRERSRVYGVIPP